MNRLIIVGSPRVDGRSAHLADLLFETCIEECPDDELALVPVSTLDIAPCQGCDACRGFMERIAEDDASGEGEADKDQASLPRCVIQDDMAEVYELIEVADEVIVVSPVYFAGPPSQLAALLDRLQPYYWTDARKASKRPATLHVVGEGGDPHGFDPLIGIVRSALSCAGFELSRVLDWVGNIDEGGEIKAEAVNYPIPPLPGVAKVEKAPAGPDGEADDGAGPKGQVDGATNIVRPKFSLGQADAKVNPAEPVEKPSRKGNNPARKGGNQGRKGGSSGNRGGKRRG